jgi:hypothetical protein
MDISDLKIECDGRTCVKVWAKCHSAEDIDDMIAWLHLAKGLMLKWEKIRARNAEAPRAPKASAGEHEASQPRKVQGEPQVPQGTDGQ